MTTEIFPDQELPELSDKPTYLTLFHYSEQDLSRARSVVDNISSYYRHLRRARDSMDEKRNHISQIAKRLDKTIVDTDSSIRDVMTTISISLAYRIFQRDLSGLGFSETQVFTFFKDCLNLNLRFKYELDRTFGNNLENKHGTINSDTFQRSFLPIIKEVGKNTPSWFTGTSNDYIRLLTFYTTIQVLMVPDEYCADLDTYTNYIKNTMQKKAIQISRLHFTVDNFPEWCHEDTQPLEEEYQQELDNDRQDYTSLIAQRVHIYNQRQFLVKSYNDKATKARVVFDRQSVPYYQDLPLVYMTSTLQASGDLPSIKPEAIINEYSQSDIRLTDTEAISLWLEDILKTAGVIQRGFYTVKGEELLEKFLASLLPQASEIDKQNFNSLKLTDKKAYQALNYNLGPLLRQLEEDDLLFLYTIKKTADLSTYSPQEMIRDFSELISSSLRNLTVDSTSKALLDKYPLGPALNTYQEFLRKFVRSNWRWLFNEMRTRLYGSTEKRSINEDLDQQQEIIIEEVDNEILDLERGQLADWEIRYSLNGTLNKSDLLEIEGKTLDEKSEFLKRLLVKYGISCSSDPANVITALERKSVESDAEEYQVPVYVIKDVEFKRKRVGSVRVFYKMNKASKQMYFFIYQKKDWGYDFTGL